MIDVNVYENFEVYYGDIHNHCAISYGHGSIKDAFANAQLQLDFCSVTGHGYWPDMPRDEDEEEYQYSSWQRENERTVRFKTQTSGNPTVFTNASQGMMLEVKMPREGKVVANINGKTIKYKLNELLKGSRAGYLGGFVTAAYRFHKAPLLEEYEWSFSLQDSATANQKYDFYYVRVCQKNGQWAWSSPVWVK